jgi:aminoglycoside phosphotransferase (APT) family kinase protein
MMGTAAIDTRALAQVAGRALGRDVTIDGLRRLSGGASRETWAFEAVALGGARHGLVLRRDPSASESSGTDRSTEYALLEVAGRHGVPVPHVRALLEAADGIGSGFLMDHIDGETIARRILRDDEYAKARELLAGQCGTVAAAIHAIPTEELPPLAVQDAVTLLAQYRAVLDTTGEPHPAFELGLRWLEARIPPPPERPALVHGDFRNGNFIVGAEGLRAVLDWELAHLGDPIEDLGWLCVKSWRFGNTDRLVGGFGGLDALLDAYEAAGGGRVDRDAVRFWLAFGTLKWGVICIMQAFTHLNGVVHSVELATLGRRVAEMEWDLLDIMDGGW